MDIDQAIQSGLERLPRNLLGQVAFHLVVDGNGVGGDPSVLLPFLLASKTVYSALTFDEYPQLYYDLYCATFDYTALQRRFNWMARTMAAAGGSGATPAPAKEGGGGGGGGGKKMFKLFDDPRSWAIDYRTRWEMARRMKRVVKYGKLYGPGICDRETVIGDLWNIWFLLTENDGKNVSFLATSCDYPAWICLYYRHDVLEDSLRPGYPRDTGDKSLGVWCSLLSGTDSMEEQTPAEIDEKIFMLRPYVFACAKYDITYAPWHHRRLPLAANANAQTDGTNSINSDSRAQGPAHPNNDIANRSKAIPYKRFGYTWRRAPPHFVLGTYLVFLRLLERHPDRMSLSSQSSTFATSAMESGGPGLFSVTRLLPSIYHDREWQRNSVCQDPYTSPGLPAMTFHGELRGFWRGKFLFYDFELYRGILAGDMRGLYTGAFADQVAEMELEETVIRVKKDAVGGEGPLLAAGFRDIESEESEREQARVRVGYGNQVVNPDEPDEPGWTKEILLSGRCRSEWGWASVRGRVRAWDGLVILAITYERQGMSKWLWRGYLHTGGHLIGRWRDSFTDEHLRGYEGAFGMIRAGDIFWPSHFPTSMDQSLGMQAQPGSAQTTPAAPNGSGQNPHTQVAAASTGGAST